MAAYPERARLAATAGAGGRGRKRPRARGANSIRSTGGFPMTSRAFAAATLAALTAAAVTAQQPTFRTQIELVQIDAIVTDEHGNLVTGLTANDFEIRENGKPQSIAAFSTVDIPI